MFTRLMTLRVWVPLLLVALYGFALFVKSDRFSMTPFREAQTAITSYYMAKGESPFLAYEVPVLGEPWAVPMEFPLYQWVLAKLGGENIHVIRWVGRILSLLFWFGCLYLAYLISGHAPIAMEERRWFVCLLAAAPVLVGYSAALLIESFALFWALGYLWFYLRARQRPTVGIVVVTCLLGLLASLSKPTTWAPFGGVIILATALDLFVGLRARASIGSLIAKSVRAGVIVCVPLIAGFMWVKYGDSVKMENPLTVGLTSESLSSWNYGTLAQKLSPLVWGVILAKQWILLFGFAAILLPFVLCAGAWGSMLKMTDYRSAVWLILAIAGYFSAPVVFTNLHFRHDYYLFANGFFLIAAFVLALGILRTWLTPKWIQAVYVLTLISAGSVSFGYIGLRKSLSEPVEDVVIREVLALKQPGPVIYLGLSWSSKIPYEVERRALMLDINNPDHPRYQEAVALNVDHPWAAVIVARPEYDLIAIDLAERLGIEFPYEKEIWPGARLLSREPIVDTELSSERHPLLGRIQERLDGRDIKSAGIVYTHNPLMPDSHGESFFELMLRRGDDLFFIDAKEWSLFRIRGFFSED
jgi:hypothetical protein